MFLIKYFEKIKRCELLFRTVNLYAITHVYMIFIPLLLLSFLLTRHFPVSLPFLLSCGEHLDRKLSNKPRVCVQEEGIQYHI